MHEVLQNNNCAGSFHAETPPMKFHLSISLWNFCPGRHVKFSCKTTASIAEWPSRRDFCFGFLNLIRSLSGLKAAWESLENFAEQSIPGWSCSWQYKSRSQSFRIKMLYDATALVEGNPATFYSATTGITLQQLFGPNFPVNWRDFSLMHLPIGHWLVAF